ncbi:MAG TPA: hypothetical protein V6D48_19410 [Oculatellaceae cyanobacterium]
MCQDCGCNQFGAVAIDGVKHHEHSHLHEHSHSHDREHDHQQRKAEGRGQKEFIPMLLAICMSDRTFHTPLPFMNPCCRKMIA